MKAYCKCKNLLIDSQSSNDTEYYVYSNREEFDILNTGSCYVKISDIPQPKYNVFHCKECNRITVFDKNYNIVKVYALEECNSTKDSKE